MNRMNRLLIVLMSLVILFASACSNTPASLPSAPSPVSAAQPVPSAPAPSAPPAAPKSDNVKTYLTLVGHNVPNKMAVVLTAPAGKNLPINGQCLLQYGGTITPGPVTGDQIALTYSFAYPPAPGYCPSGVQFTLPKAVYDGSADQTKAVDDKFQAELTFMSQVTTPTEPLTAVDFPMIPFIRVMNVGLVSHADNSYGFWSMCSIGDDNAPTPSGKLGKVMDTPWGTLVLYTNAGPRSGKECPSGTLFLLEDQQFDVPLLLDYEHSLPLS